MEPVIHPQKGAPLLANLGLGVLSMLARDSPA
jgi:hypothetical protein